MASKRSNDPSETPKNNSNNLNNNGEKKYEEVNLYDNADDGREQGRPTNRPAEQSNRGEQNRPTNRPAEQSNRGEQNRPTNQPTEQFNGSEQNRPTNQPIGQSNSSEQNRPTNQPNPNYSDNAPNIKNPGINTPTVNNSGVGNPGAPGNNFPNNNLGNNSPNNNLPNNSGSSPRPTNAASKPSDLSNNRPGTGNGGEVSRPGTGGETNRPSMGGETNRPNSGNNVGNLGGLAGAASGADKSGKSNSIPRGNNWDTDKVKNNGLGDIAKNSAMGAANKMGVNPLQNTPVGGAANFAQQASQVVQKTVRTVKNLVHVAVQSVSHFLTWGWMVLLALVVVAALVVTIVAAYQVIGNNDNLECDTAGGSSSSAWEDSEDPEENALNTMNWLTSNNFEFLGGKPMTPEQAAGVVGNFWKESGVKFAIAEHKGSNADGSKDKMSNEEANSFTISEAPAGLGIAQWTWNPGRAKDLLDVASEKSANWYDPDVQLTLMQKEMDNSYGPRLLAAGFGNEKDPGTNALTFHTIYEGSADGAAGLSARQDFAKKALDLYKNGGGGSSSAGGSSSSGGSGSCLCRDGATGSSSGKFIIPAEGTITSNFGMIDSVHTVPHDGTDIANTQGSDIHAFTDGKVVSAGDAGDGYGKKVLIDHEIGGKKFQSLYGHNSSVKVKVGDSVKAGDVIAQMGSTGFSTGSHHHFGFYKDDWGGGGNSSPNLLDSDAWLSIAQPADGKQKPTPMAGINDFDDKNDWKQNVGPKDFGVSGGGSSSSSSSSSDSGSSSSNSSSDSGKSSGAGGERLVVIGDSTTEQLKADLDKQLHEKTSYKDIVIDSRVSRGVPEGVGVAQGKKNSTATDWFIGLGINGGNPGDVDSMMSVLKDQGTVWWPEIHADPSAASSNGLNAPQDMIDNFNKALHAAESKYDNLKVPSWSPENSVYADGVHYNAEGMSKRVEFIVNTITNSSGTSSNSDPCAGSSSGGDGDIKSLAIKLAWPRPDYSKSISNGGTGKPQAKPEYIEYKEKIEKTTGADPWKDLYASCDRFVATVVRNTVDENYPWGPVSAQEAYVKGEGKDKWEVLDISEAKPGDILIMPNHTAVYIGDEDGEDSVADASYMERTGGVNGAGWSKTHAGVFVARPK